MDKIMKGIVVANIAIIISVFISVGFYLKTIDNHENNIKETEDAVKVVDSKQQASDKAINKRMTEIAEAGVARDNNNEKSIVVIESKLNGINDKLDLLVCEVRDIKKIVLKPIAGTKPMSDFFYITASTNGFTNNVGTNGIGRLVASLNNMK